MAVLSLLSYLILRHFIFRCLVVFDTQPIERRLVSFEDLKRNEPFERIDRGVDVAWGREGGQDRHQAEDTCHSCMKSLQRRCPRLDYGTCDDSCVNLADVSSDGFVCAPSSHLDCKHCDIEAACHDDCAGHASKLKADERIAKELTDALTLFGVFFLQPCFASFYKYFVVDRKPRLTAAPVHDQWRSQGSEFRYAIYECLGDPHLCLHGFCCSATRLADTYASAGIWNFWANFLAVTLIYGMDAWMRWKADLKGASTEPQPLLIGSVVYAVFFAWRRGALRRGLGGDGCGPMDCVWLWCCPHLAAIQEARHLDDVLGVKTSCCCDTSTGGADEISQPLVGMPVSAMHAGVLAASTREVQLVQTATQYAETQPLAMQALRDPAAPAHFSGTAHRLDDE